MGLLEKIARALAQEAGKDPDEVVQFQSCGGPMELPRWAHEFGEPARRALLTVGLHLEMTDVNGSHRPAVNTLGKALEAAR
jgi:hypothetical protein